MSVPVAWSLAAMTVASTMTRRDPPSAREGVSCRFSTEKEAGATSGLANLI